MEKLSSYLLSIKFIIDEVDSKANIYFQNCSWHLSDFSFCLILLFGIKGSISQF